MTVTINGTTGIVTPDIGIDGTTFVVDAANNRVGVLEDSPSNTLTVGDTVQPSYAPTRAGNYIEIARTSGADAGLLINKDTGQWLVGINNGDGANAPLRFEYAAAGSSHPGLGAGTLGMIIKHDGKVGINNSNPSSYLHVAAGDYQTLRLENTDNGANGPYIEFYNNSSSPADNDYTGIISFKNRNSNNEEITYSQIRSQSVDVTDGAEDGNITFHTRLNGSFGERLRIDSSGRLLKSGQASLTSTTLSYPIQVAAASDANAIAIFGRAADDIGELAFYEADKTTKLGELQYRQDHLNLRCRVGDIRFASGGTLETLRIDGSGRIAQGGKTPTNHGSPNLLIWGSDPTVHLTSTGSTANTSYTGIKFAVAGGSTGDYSKAGIFVQRQDSYNDLDMIFAFRSTNDAAGVAISDEKIRITSDGNVGIGTDNPISELMVENATQSHITVKTSGSNMAKFGSKGNDVYIGGTAGAANIIFKRNIVSTDHPADSGTETLRIQSTGGISFNGDTAAANALDDYEEGTWTPVLAGSVTAGSLTAGTAEGRYIKIGKMVYLTWRFNNATFSGSVGSVKITGVPYNQVSTNAYPSAAFGMTNNVVFNTDRNQAWYIGGSVIEGIESRSAAGWQSIPASFFHATNFYMNQFICYEAA